MTTSRPLVVVYDSGAVSPQEITLRLDDLGPVVLTNGTDDHETMRGVLHDALSKLSYDSRLPDRERRTTDDALLEWDPGTTKGVPHSLVPITTAPCLAS